MTSRANNKSCSLNVMRNQNNGTLFSTETTLLSNKSLDFRLHIFTYLYYTAKLHTIIHVHFTTSFMKKKNSYQYYVLQREPIYCLTIIKLIVRYCKWASSIWWLHTISKRQSSIFTHACIWRILFVFVFLVHDEPWCVWWVSMCVCVFGTN